MEWGTNTQRRGIHPSQSKKRSGRHLQQSRKGGGIVNRAGRGRVLTFSRAVSKGRGTLNRAGRERASSLRMKWKLRIESCSFNKMVSDHLKPNILTTEKLMPTNKTANGKLQGKQRKLSSNLRIHRTMTNSRGRLLHLPDIHELEAHHREAQC